MTDRESWLSRNSHIIVDQILDLTNKSCMRYSDHSTKQKWGGDKDILALRFICDNTGDTISAYYNARVTYSRNGKNHCAGDLLPRGNFSVGDRSTYAKFCKTVSIPRPRYKSEYRDQLHWLKHLLFNNESEIIKEDRRVTDKLIPLINITQRQVMAAKESWEDTGKVSVNHRESIGKHDREDLAPERLSARLIRKHNYVSGNVRAKSSEQCMEGLGSHDEHMVNGSADQSIEQEPEDPWLVGYNSKPTDPNKTE